VSRVLQLDGRELDAVLFDMDGTLVRSHAAVERAWVTWSVEHGLDPTLVLPHVHGSPAERTVRRFLPALGDRDVRAAAQRQLDLQYDDLHDMAPMPGAIGLLAHLDASGVPWAVVTSADRRLAAARLGASAIEPPVLVTVEDVRRGKPHPDGYLEAARRLGVLPARSLVVEDAEVGVDAGRAAGMVVAALRPVTGDVNIGDLGELLDRLRGVTARG
jgi:HAD superfamily hydrolase (TIGR01509 family)